MKAQTAPRVGIIDALAAGLSLTSRRLWLMIVPVAIDIALWLAPRLSVEALLARWLVAWEALLTVVYTPAQLAALGDMLTISRDAIAQMGQQSDIGLALTGGWLSPTSALAPVQANRLLLVSDGVLAPLGLGLQLPGMTALIRASSGAIEMGSGVAVVLVAVVLWLVAQLLATAYLRWAAVSLDGAVVGRGKDDRQAASAAIHIEPVTFSRLFLRFLGLSLLLGIVLMIVRVPLAMLTAFAMLSGGSGAALLFILSGSLTLWLTMSLLVSVFFTSDALLLDGQGLLGGIWRSLIVVRSSNLRTLGFVLLINLLMLGARAVWGLIGGTPVGVAAAILGNGYLVTGMVLASMIYYDGLRREWQAVAAGQVSK